MLSDYIVIIDKGMIVAQVPFRSCARSSTEYSVDILVTH